MHSNLVKLDKQFFEIEMKSESILIHKYAIQQQSGQYRCEHNLHAYIMTEESNHIDLKKHPIFRLQPNRFISFYSIYPSDKLNYKCQQFVQSYCAKDSLIMTEEDLLNLPSYPTFVFTVSQFLLNKVLKSHPTAVLAPKKWIFGVKKNLPKICDILDHKN